MTFDDYQLCLKIARRHARDDADAADLLHEALLAGVRVGRLDFSEKLNRAWLSGVIRNLAAASARGAVRRKRREANWVDETTDVENAALEVSAETTEILDSLSEGAKRVAVLALYGMNPDEICYVLQLKPAAFRQRLTGLRRSLGKLPDPLPAEAMALAYTRPRRHGEGRLDFGLIRRALLHHIYGIEAIGTHDPDGHLFGIRTR